MGPLSAKQHREYLAFAGKEQREQAKLAREEARKDELHALKLIESGAKAVQGISQKDDTHKVKMKELGGKASPAPTTMVAGPLSAQSFSAPTNPEAGPSDTVPAMLTPGEAVIPAPAAQDPANQPIIKAMVEQGRSANDSLGYASGTRSVSSGPSIPKAVGGKGSRRTVLPKIARINQVGFADGTEKVPDKKAPPLGSGLVDAARKLLQGRTRQVDKEIDKASGYADGTTKVPEAPLGSGMVQDARKKLKGRKEQLEEQERKAMGYADGTENVMDDPAYWNERAKRAKNDFVPPKGFGQKDSDVDITPVSYDDGKGAQRIASDIDALTRELSRAKDPETKAILQSELDKRSGGVVVPPMAAAQPTPQQIEQASKPVPQLKPGGTGRDYRAAGYDWLSGKTEPTKITDVPPTEMRGRALDVQSGMRDSLLAPRKDSLVVKKEALPPLPVKDVAEGIPPLPAKEGVDLTKEVPKLPVTGEEAGNAAVAILETPEKQAIYDMFQAEAPKVPDKDKPAFLEKMIDALYGDTGMFKPEELARFAVVAAGGLLTGGSVAGSLRYAAKDVLAVSDSRRAAQGAAEGEQRKDTRELAQQLDGRIAEYMSKDVPPAVRAEAIRLRRTPVKNASEMIARDRSVVELLSANVQHKDKNADAGKLGDFKTGYVDGSHVKYYEDGKGGILLRNNDGSIAPLPKGQKMLPEGTYKDLRNQMQSNIKSMVAPALRSVYGKDKNVSIPELADKLSVTFDTLFDDMGNPEPKYFATLVEGTVRQLKRDDDVTNIEEALRKGMYGQAARALSPNDDDLFKTGPKRKGEPSVQGLGQFGNVVSSLVTEAKAEAAAKGLPEGNMNIAAVSQALIQQYRAAPVKEKEIAERAALLSEDKNSQYYGMSPFMIWVTQNKR